MSGALVVFNAVHADDDAILFRAFCRSTAARIRLFYEPVDVGRGGTVFFGERRSLFTL